jgi:hypothetical protein
MSAIETFFITVINSDGSISTLTEFPTEPFEVARTASRFDVYQTSKQIVDEVEQSALVERIVAAVTQSLNPPVQTVPDRVKEALKNRGIDPESVTPVS